MKHQFWCFQALLLLFMHAFKKKNSVCKRCLNVKTWPTLGHLRYGIHYPVHPYFVVSGACNVNYL